MVLTYTKYKEDAPRAEDKPKRELTISEWLHEMAEAGFTGQFKALNNDGRLYKGELMQEGDKVLVKSRKVPQQEEARRKILEALKKN